MGQDDHEVEGPAAFEQTYREFLPKVYRYFAGQVASLEDAEDLTAQTFTLALQGWGQRTGDLYTPWLFAIAHNQLISYRRRRGLQRGTTLPAWGRELAGGDPAESTTDPYEVRRLRQALSRLSALDSELLMLCFGSGMTYPEAAIAVGMRPAAVKMRVRRAIGRLRLTLDGMGVASHEPR